MHILRDIHHKPYYTLSQCIKLFFRVYPAHAFYSIADMKKTKFSLEEAKRSVKISSQIEGHKIGNDVPEKDGENKTQKSRQGSSKKI